MKTAPQLDVELGEALDAYAERIPARPDPARLHAALAVAPAAGPARRRPGRTLMTGVAASAALVLGAGSVWALSSANQGNDPVINVTAFEPSTSAEPASTVAPSTAAPTTPAPTTAAPTTAPPATAAPVQVAPPPAQGAAAASNRPAAAASGKKSRGSAGSTQRNQPAPSGPVAPAKPPTNAVAFSAGAAFGSCSDDPPYDIYSGTANPGSRITISSPFGGGSTTADEHGQWEEKVVFASSPVGETFTVTVSSPQGSDTFSFTHSG